jgi:hypothetical protein
MSSALTTAAGKSLMIRAAVTALPVCDVIEAITTTRSGRESAFGPAEGAVEGTT